MAKSGFTSVQEYIASQPEDVQAILARVRSTIRKALPNAEETISYQIPAYKQHGHTVIYFAAWKEHFSLYPATRELVAAFMDDLTRYKISKGTIRFPLSERVPIGLIGRIAKFRAREAAEYQQAKAARSKRT